MYIKCSVAWLSLPRFRNGRWKNETFKTYFTEFREFVSSEKYFWTSCSRCLGYLVQSGERMSPGANECLTSPILAGGSKH